MKSAIAERQWAVEASGGANYSLPNSAIPMQLRGIEGTRLRSRPVTKAFQNFVRHVLLDSPNPRKSGEDKAFHWLEMSYQERSPTLSFLKIDPRLDVLRADPRFDSRIWCRLNLPV